MIKKLLVFVVLVVSSYSKFCINCKHYRASKLAFSKSKYGTCSMFQSSATDVTREKNVTDYKFCSTARKTDDMCGPIAKYYEPKQ